MTRTVRTLLAALIAAAVVLLPTAAHADTDDFTFDSFHADFELSRAADGHAELTVTETIVARFPDEDQNRGIVRAIPDRYDRVPLRTEIVSVTDASGQPVPYEIERNGDDIDVLTGDDDYVRGVQTYVITYTQRDSIRAFSDTEADEFYRDVNGTGWAQPFGEVTASLIVDDELQQALTGNAACYVGDQGDGTACPSAPTGATSPLDFGATDIEPEQTLTIAVGFEAGTFEPGEVVLTPIERFGTDAAPVLHGLSIAAIVGSFGAVGGALVARHRRRGADGRGVIVPQYDASPGLSVLQAAHLVGRPGPAVSAAIVDLAVAGHLRIVEHGDDTFSLQYLAPAPNDPGRQRVIDALFGDAPTPNTGIRLDGASEELAKRMTSLSGGEHRSLRDLGFTAPRSATAPTVAILAVVGLFIAALLALIVTANAGTLTWFGVAAVPAVVVVGIVAIFLVRYGDRVTDAGAPARDHLLGLRDYLQLAEADRLAMLQSPEGAERRSLNRGPDAGVDGAAVVHLYERLLPYAVVWGFEKEWADALATRAAETGTDLGWYRGTSPFTSLYLMNALTAANSSTSVTHTATSGSGSFSGGSMGGGFAGGGAGGGGGGGR